MNGHNYTKKPIYKDWHRADVVAALWKKGQTLRKLAKHHGYAGSQPFTQALGERYPKVERLIAEAIGVPPEQIWPSRYTGSIARGRRKKAA